VKSARTECLDHLFIFNEADLRRVIRRCFSLGPGRPAGGSSQSRSLADCITSIGAPHNGDDIFAPFNRYFRRESGPSQHCSRDIRGLSRAPSAHCNVLRSRRLDGIVKQARPRRLARIIGSYHRCCTELIQRNGGFDAKDMSDGVLAYFGYPQAHEHDAERTVPAGLALVEAIPKLETAAVERTLQVRAGIATVWSWSAI